MLAVARRICRSDADADDAVQEAFLSAFKALPAFDGRSRLSTWLHRITVNAALMKLRSARSKRETSIDALLPQFKEDGHHAQSPKRWISVTEDGPGGIEPQRAIREALEQIPDEFRTVLVLKDVAGLESKAIAASLGISDAAVRQRLHRARQAMMKLLAPTPSEPNA